MSKCGSFEELKKKTEVMIENLHRRKVVRASPNISINAERFADYLTDVLVFLEVFENATEVIPNLHAAEVAGAEQ